MRKLALLSALLLSGCTGGTWYVETYPTYYNPPAVIDFYPYYYRAPIYSYPRAVYVFPQHRRR